MPSEWVQRILSADAALTKAFARVTHRPWGDLCHNPDNANHHDANSARVQRIAPRHAEAVIDEIIAFYRARGLVPRAKLTNLTEPADMTARFQARGFHIATEMLRVMAWEGPVVAAPPVLPGITIAPAGPGDLAALVQVFAEANGYAEDPAWVRGMISQGLAHPALTYYLAKSDAEPVACLLVGRMTDVGLVENVSTRPGFRGRGVAAALVAHAQAAATGPLALYVAQDSAWRIYARAGFQEWGRITSSQCRL